MDGATVVGIVTAAGVWTTILAGLQVFVTKSIVASEIKKINGTYRRTESCKLMMQRIEDHLKISFDDINHAS